jgi:hypothetical protein
MKRLIITEEEKNRIFDLYKLKNINLQEQSNNCPIGNSETVKKFQLWLNKNVPGWHEKYPEGVPQDANKGFGACGPRTIKQWGNIKNRNLFLQTENIKSKNTNVNSEFCPTISDKSKDIKDLNTLLQTYKSYEKINTFLNIGAKIFSNQGFPQRISCELSLNKIRPGYKDKNLIIVDTLQKLIFVFEKNGKFVQQSVIISGENKQSQDPKTIAKALLGWDDQVKNLGFKWDTNKKQYVDTTGKNRKYNPELVYSDTEKSGTKFLPKGIYTTGKSLDSDEEYAGNKDNMLSLFKDNKEIGQAIHGYYLEKPREIALANAKKLLSNPNNPNVSKEFLDSIGAGKINLSRSYGCINVPSEFLPVLRKYMVNSYVFNIGETGDNYLVNNAENYFDKMLNYENCPSPQSLGAVEPTRLA